uniref:Lymphocyte antigen 6 family member G6E n=1 Tax=Propithecus coquereli TaxID=379532 RepID=A0A2K6FD90_PROCO
MGTSSILLCILFLRGALGLTTTSPARGRLRCYTCTFAKPCYPVPTECQDDEVCGISIGTSGRTLVQWPFSGGLPTSIHPAFPVLPSAFLLCPTDQSEVIER